jgi:Flp pilus assembly protein TadG
MKDTHMMTNSKTSRMKRKNDNEHGGVILAFLAIGLLVFMGLAVVAIDFSHLGLSTNEVQIVADTAATAGARSLMRNAQGATESPVAVAQAVVAENHVDTGPASIAAGDVEVGTYDFNSSSFSPGGANPNAVRATGRATVSNMVAGIFGADTTDVERQAIAAYAGNRSAAPVCPITVGLCEFAAYQSSPNCSNLPELSQVPSATDTSGWTSLGSAAASANQAVSYLPEACGGGGVPAPTVRVGDTINVMNGQANNVLKTLEDCYNAGLLTECTIPIVNIPCNTGFNQARPVVAFATFRITGFNSMGSDKSIQLDGVCTTDEPGTPGGTNLGTLSMALVD